MLFRSQKGHRLSCHVGVMDDLEREECEGLQQQAIFTHIKEEAAMLVIATLGNIIQEIILYVIYFILSTGYVVRTFI